MAGLYLKLIQIEYFLDKDEQFFFKKVLGLTGIRRYLNLKKRKFLKRKMSFLSVALAFDLVFGLVITTANAKMAPAPDTQTKKCDGCHMKILPVLTPEPSSIIPTVLINEQGVHFDQSQMVQEWPNIDPTIAWHYYLGKHLVMLATRLTGEGSPTLINEKAVATAITVSTLRNPDGSLPEVSFIAEEEDEGSPSLVSCKILAGANIAKTTIL